MCLDRNFVAHRNYFRIGYIGVDFVPFVILGSGCCHFDVDNCFELRRRTVGVVAASRAVDFDSVVDVDIGSWCCAVGRFVTA